MSDVQGPRSPVSRRAFLGTSVAAGGAAVAASRLGGAAVIAPPASGSDDLGESAGPISTEPVIAHLSDLSSGTISLYVGEREVVVQDRALARRLASAANPSV